VSLHSAIDEIRSQIMPFSKISLWLIYGNHWNIGRKTKVKFPTNMLWKDINDNKESIDALVKFCKYVPCKVNLIEYNPIDDGEFQQASEDATNAYKSVGVKWDRGQSKT
jgi:23S rRNA (adenine2503-C2)-methyltransferase